ncbi:MAG: hypothetical protein HQL58_09000 [Magnetococcales bacterium]|nr:hypothetical protein [Magnetococcales bacterium]
MRPRINLFQKELFAVQNDWLDASKAFWIVLAALFFVLIGSATLWLQSYSLSREADQLQSQEKQLYDRLTQLASALPANEEDPALVGRIAQLEADIKIKKQVLELLSGQRIGNRQGFSGQFIKLAQNTFPDLWLTQLQLLDGGRQLVFVGRTLKSASVFDFVKQLTDEGVFKGVQFPYFQMNLAQAAEPGAAAQIRFGLATQLDALLTVWQEDLSQKEAEANSQKKFRKGDGDAASSGKNPMALLNTLMRQSTPKEGAR